MMKKTHEREATFLQKSVHEFIAQHQLSCGVESRFIDLTSEMGELGKELLKGSDYGKSACRITENAEDELGDCLFSLLALACEMNINAENALKHALEKYQKRFSEKQEISSGR